MFPLKRILCPTDFSEPSYAALATAGDLAAQFNAELCVLNVIEPLPTVLGIVPVEELDASRVTDTAQEIHRVVKARVDKSVRTRAIVKCGGPAAEILRAADEEEPDLIVIATHGLTGWRHFVFGSVAEAVVRLAHHPVLTVHGPPTEHQVVPAAGSDSEPPSTHAATSVEAKSAAPPRDIDPWDVEEQNFPARGTNEEKLRFLLNYAVLAPSSHNSQPWLWKLDGNTVELYADRTRSLPVVDPRGRELIISCGTALFNLRLAMWHFGYRPEVMIFPDPVNSDLLARLALGNRRQTADTSSDERALFEAITRRHTNRMLFEERDLPLWVLQELKDAARREGAVLRFVASSERDTVVDLIKRGDVMQGHDREFRSELAAWIRPNNSTLDDGIPGHALGMSNMVSHLSPEVIRTLDIEQAQAAKDHVLVERAPMLALLEAENDTPRQWLATGQALSHVLLRAHVHGVDASFFNQPVEVGELWRQIRQELGLSLFPQLLFRLGYAAAATDLKPTPRRPVDEVVVDNIVQQQALQEFVASQR
jgi:nucleotide-binding universal stress UspA family protein